MAPVSNPREREGLEVMAPAPVTRDCGCEPGVKLCPTAQRLRRKANEATAQTFGADQRSEEAREARRAVKAAFREFRAHVGGKS